MAYTLNGAIGQAVATFAMQSLGEYKKCDTASSIKARDGKDATDLIVFSLDSMASNSMKSSNPWSGCNVVDKAKTVDTSDQNPAKNQGGIAILDHHSVRRLTPVECERLQGFPDQWTAQGADGKHISDSARYAAIGNSVALPCVDYVISGIVAAMRQTDQ